MGTLIKYVTPMQNKKLSIYVVYNGRDVFRNLDGLEKINSEINQDDNISKKIDYCELRAHYYIWKNKVTDDSEYIGFFHYRRYLDFSRGGPYVSKTKMIPYRIIENPYDLSYSENQIYNSLSGFDVIVPLPEYTGKKVLIRYSDMHRAEDLEIVSNIIDELFFEYSEAKNIYLNKKEEFYCNMFIMKKELFNDYCNWLFNILSEYDKRVINKPKNVNGYIGERLLGVYITYLEIQGKKKIGFLPRLHFYIYDDKKHNYRFKSIINIIFRPGARYTCAVKKIIRRFIR